MKSLRFVMTFLYHSKKTKTKYLLLLFINTIHSDENMKKKERKKKKN